MRDDATRRIAKSNVKIIDWLPWNSERYEWRSRLQHVAAEKCKKNNNNPAGRCNRHLSFFANQSTTVIWEMSMSGLRRCEDFFSAHSADASRAFCAFLNMRKWYLQLKVIVDWTSSRFEILKAYLTNTIQSNLPQPLGNSNNSWIVYSTAFACASKTANCDVFSRRQRLRLEPRSMIFCFVSWCGVKSSHRKFFNNNRSEKKKSFYTACNARALQWLRSFSSEWI